MVAQNRTKSEWEKPENQQRLEELIGLFGEYKKVVDQGTGVAYRVPTKDIITKGFRQEDLSQYPVLKDG